MISGSGPVLSQSAGGSNLPKIRGRGLGVSSRSGALGLVAAITEGCRRRWGVEDEISIRLRFDDGSTTRVLDKEGWSRTQGRQKGRAVDDEEGSRSGRLLEDDEIWRAWWC